VICAECGTQNEPGRKFCGECGQRLAAPCPTCGTPNTPGTKFCGECGTPLPAGDATASVAAPEALTPATERRLVSVLFADLVGFTTISESRDAEDVRELLTRYFDVSREIVERYGGTVEKFIGDAVMAVWGTPAAQEDDAERAVRAALDLVDAVRQLGTAAGVEGLDARAAVHTGEAVVTLGATGMGMVAGDLVNTASRLQSVAAPGTVLVGEGTRRAAAEAIVFEPAGEQALKGKVSPIPAFRALRVVAQRGGVGRSEQLEPPFVGRDAEMRLIKDFYHATARERGPRLVSVIGQPGIGKSRLAWEFLKYIDGVTEVVHWHEGRSPAYGEGISFWALGEMVRMRAGIGEGDDETTTRRRVSDALDEFVHDPDERRTLEGPLLNLLGVEDGPRLERGQLFTAWRTFFERVAEMGPVVMVFEDLQWADDGMLDFVEELVTWSRGRSIYIITLARPDLLDRRSGWGAGLRSFTSLNLTPLTDADIAELLAGMVPGLPSAAVEAIVSRAEGIPLYAVETVRMLLNDGRIERHGDTFQPVGSLDKLAVPESLHALIAARIDALAPGERRLLQDASVLGLSFAPSALVAIGRGAAGEVEGMLRHLAQRELLVFDDDPKSPERGQYRFVQGLMREVAYGTLSRDDRRARHLAAARYYEALGDDELAGILAQHYLDAYTAHPEGAEGAAVAAQARVALRGAAQRAANLGSFRRAHGYLTSALEAVTEPAEELEVRVAAGRAAAMAAMIDAARSHGERAIELARQLGDDERRRTATAWLADVLLEGHQQESLELLRAAMADPDLTPDSPGYLDLATTLGKVEMRQLNDVRAVEVADQALPVAGRLGDELNAIELIITRSVSLANLGRTTEAVIGLTGAVEVARQKGFRLALFRAAINLGYAIVLDDPRRAFDVSRQAYQEALESGHVIAVRYLLGNAIDTAIETGDWDWGLTELRDKDFLFVEPAERFWFGAYETVYRALRGEDVAADSERLHHESRGVDDPQFRVIGLLPLLYVHLLNDDLEALQRAADETLANGLAGVQGALFGARGAIWRGDVETARRMRKAHEIAPTARQTTAERTAMDAGIAALEGRRPEARQLYGRAQQAFRELGSVLSLLLTDIDVVVTGSMEPDERQAAAEEAHALAERLGAPPLLARLERARAAERPVAPYAAEASTTADEVRSQA
jgi:class 3 adenylate cyclase